MSCKHCRLFLKGTLVTISPKAAQWSPHRVFDPRDPVSPDVLAVTDLSIMLLALCLLALTQASVLPGGDLPTLSPHCPASTQKIDMSAYQ